MYVGIRYTYIFCLIKQRCSQDILGVMSIVLTKYKFSTRDVICFYMKLKENTSSHLI